jgi:hypothetical protein
MMNLSMYEVALRKKIRFDSSKGQLSLEQVWDVPLRSRDEFNLDAMAKAANRTVKDCSEESFVNPVKTTAQAEAELRLDIIKHVIDTKIGEEAAAEKRAENAKKRERLLGALEKKQDSKIDDMTEAQIKRQLEALSD